MINFTKPKSRLNYTKVNEIFNKFLEIKEIDPSFVKVLFLLNLLFFKFFIYFFQLSVTYNLCGF